MLGSSARNIPREILSAMEYSGLFDFWDPSCRPLEPGVPPDEPGFSGATVMRITTTRGPLAVRGWPPDGLPRQRLEALHRLLEHVAATVPVAVPITTGDGTRLADWHGRLWQLEPWMPGTADFHDDPSRVRLDEAMATLARFHRAARGFVPDREAETWFGSSESRPSPAVGERLEQLTDYQRRWDRLVDRARGAVSGQADWMTLLADVDELFGRGADEVAGQLRMVRMTGYRCQPCLRDIWHDHLLWTGDRVTGLIDPGSCRSDNVAIDLARLLGSLVGDDTEAWDAGLAAYDRHARLDLTEAGLVTVLDQSAVLLSGAVWVERLAEGRVGVPSAGTVHRRLSEVVSRLRGLAERLGFD